MPKQEYKILEFHGGTNHKFDPRDIADNQNAYSQLSVNKVGRLVKEGDAKNLYNKTDINGHSITDITSFPVSNGGFTRGYGLFSFPHDYDMDSPPDEVNTDFICINDANGIDIYDPNQSTEWQQNKFYLGSRVATVKPEYYNVDGALRVCDTNFSVTDAAMDTAANIGKNDITLTIDNGAGGNVTLASGSIIQIDQEIMYVVTGVTGGTSVKVIRGYANTKITTHSNNTNIFYANIPKYFGHIKANRLFECETSNDVNTWVEDAQTPQPPSNTRKSDGTTATLANSAGVQSLRVYDIIEASTSNYPAESEKVILEFEEGQANVGITKVAKVDDTHVIFTTSGYGNNASGGNRLSEGEEITLTNMQGVSSVFENTYTITSVTTTSFTVEVSASIADVALDYSGSSYITAIADWYDHSESGEIDNALGVNVGATELPSSAGTIYPIHITGETGINGFNGIYEARAIDNNDLYIVSDLHGSHASGTTNGQVQQLIGIARPSESGAINPDLKRKWNFAMSFTYDGPGQEVQESLLTNGHTVYASKRNDNTTNTLRVAISDSDETIEVDDTTNISVGDIIMLSDEQMRVLSITDGDTLEATRGVNGTTVDTDIAADTQIYIISELTPTATVDWTNFSGVPSCVIKSVYNYGVDEKSWNARINGFKIYMKDVTEEDASKEFRLFAEVNFNKGTYTLFGAGDSELILEQPATSAIATLTTGTDITIKPIDTYLSENLFTEQTIIDAQYKASCVAGRKVYIGNIRQGGRTYPDRMLRTPVNKFDTFPETNFIDVAIGDGDEITVLESFGDRILQFKKTKLYVINISGEFEVLESEYLNAGVSTPGRVVKTDVGVAWVNSWGLWFFDGQQVKNLTRDVSDGKYSDQDTSIGIIGYDNRTNRLIYTTQINIGMQTGWLIYDLSLNAYQYYHDGSLFPHSESGGNFYTNIIHDSKGNMVVGYVDAGTPTELNFYEWDSSSGDGQSIAITNLFKSKDIDFGSPSVRKKVHKIYVTYKCSGHSGIQMKYATNGSDSFSGTFSSSTSTNYNADSFTSNGTRTGFKDTGGDWAVAELKPTSSINNIKSIQLSLDHLSIAAGTAQTGGGTSSIKLAAGASATAGIYNDYNIYLYAGNARYNTRIIENGTNGTTYSPDGSSRIATVLSAFTDKGYGNDANSTSTKYVLGAVASDFQINDITVIYRAKPVK